jgi:hypothetical protein
MLGNRGSSHNIAVEIKSPKGEEGLNEKCPTVVAELSMSNRDGRSIIQTERVFDIL